MKKLLLGLTFLIFLTPTLSFASEFKVECFAKYYQNTKIVKSDIIKKIEKDSNLLSLFDINNSITGDISYATIKYEGIVRKPEGISDLMKTSIEIIFGERKELVGCTSVKLIKL